MTQRSLTPFISGVLVLALISSSAVTFAGVRSGDTFATPAIRTCLSKKQKVVLLVGAAALAYMYYKHKKNRGVGPNGQYYRSRNGRIYYRDAQHRVHWVSPPSGGLRVPADEAMAAQRGGY